MKNLIYFIPGIIAVLSAIFVSIVLIEHSIVYLLCLAVGFAALFTALPCLIFSKKQRWHKVVSILIPAALFILIAWSHIPLRLTFQIHRREFDHVVSQIQADTAPQTPFWIGPFKIERVGLGNTGIPYLATNSQKYEIDGFIRSPDGQGFNLWSCITLNEDWSYISED